MRGRHLALVTAVLASSVGCASEPRSVEESPPSVSGSATATTTTTTTTTGAKPTQWPNSIVVLGHSGATGYNSDPTHPNSDAPENSWATGTNPQVNSVYLRVRAENAAVDGHNFNLAEDGAGIDNLLVQAHKALALVPLPDLFLIQTLDNDIRCDGTDPQHYESFGARLTEALQVIASGAPNARIFIVSQPGTVANNADVTSGHPDWIAKWQGDGPCDAFDKTGKLSTAHVAGLQDITDHYFAQEASSCAQFPNCTYDDGAWQRMVVVSEDFSDDGNHPSIQGHAKRAQVTWAALYG